MPDRHCLYRFPYEALPLAPLWLCSCHRYIFVSSAVPYSSPPTLAPASPALTFTLPSL